MLAKRDVNVEVLTVCEVERETPRILLAFKVLVDISFVLIACVDMLLVLMLKALRVEVTVKSPIIVEVEFERGRGTATHAPKLWMVEKAVDALAGLRGSENDLIQSVLASMIELTMYSWPGVNIPPSIDETNLVKVEVGSNKVENCNWVWVFINWKELWLLLV